MLPCCRSESEETAGLWQCRLPGFPLVAMKGLEARGRNFEWVLKQEVAHVQLITKLGRFF